MKHTKVVMIGNQCSSAGLIEDGKPHHHEKAYINVWYHSEQEESAIKLFKLCDKAPEMYEALTDDLQFVKRILGSLSSINSRDAERQINKLESLLKEIES
jgi:hypothetical protein